MFGQIIIGSPGSGKTTYCSGMQKYMKLTGRISKTINLDPFNIRDDFDLNVTEFASIEFIQQDFHFGPNCGLLFYFDYLLKNIETFIEKLNIQAQDCNYFLIDCPGQIELFTTHGSFIEIIKRIINQFQINFVVINLIDSNLCSDPFKFISATLVSLSTMLYMELPYVNILAKYDNLAKTEVYDAYLYTNYEDLATLLDCSSIRDTLSKRFLKISKNILSIIEEFGLLNFIPLDIQAKQMLASVLKAADASNGYKFSFS
jgi:hypothetical protein